MSKDLKDAFPKMPGFSLENIKYMWKFTECWSDNEIVQQVVAQIPCQTDQMLLDKSDLKSAGGMILCYIEQQNEKRKAFLMCINPDPTESPMKFKGKSQTSPCYCGHDCARCTIYIATQRNDDTLRRQSQNFYKESFGLDLPLHEFNCSGGRSDRVFKPCRECPFIRCCIRHNVDFCSTCPQYPCKEISDYQEKYVNKCNKI